MAKKTIEKPGHLTEMHPLPRRFVETDKEGRGQGIFYFHKPGDFLYGYLLTKETVQTLHYPFTSFKMKALEARQDGIDLVIDEDGEIFEFPANIVPRRIIFDNELIGRLVKIIFKGKRGRKKDYKVFVDSGTFYKNEQESHAKSPLARHLKNIKSKRKVKNGSAQS